MQGHFCIDKLLAEKLTFYSLELEDRNLYEQLRLYHFYRLIKTFNRATLENIKKKLTKGESKKSYGFDIYLQMIEEQLKSRPLL